MGEHEQVIGSAFTAQAAAYNASPTTNAAEVLDAITELAAPRPTEAWLDAACGPGIVSRRLAPRAGSVLGIDLTPAMVELARAESARAGAANARFELGDATATGLPAASLDGAVTRFSIHHVPVPGRLLDELARVVRPGGRIVVVDHAADEAAADRAFTQEVERLRDPAHWASLTPGELRALGAGAGLTPVAERRQRFAIDFEEWLTRGTSDPGARRLVERRLRERPGGTERFAVRPREGTPGSTARTLILELWLGAWVVPGGA